MTDTRTLEKIHKTSHDHRQTILASKVLGCFYCLHQFAPSDIDDWWDEDEAGVGHTATCPACGIDSVIGDGAGWSIDAELLTAMKAHFFWPD